MGYVCKRAVGRQGGHLTLERQRFEIFDSLRVRRLRENQREVHMRFSLCCPGRFNDDRVMYTQPVLADPAYSEKESDTGPCSCLVQQAPLLP
jgi:hypothetical protein